MKRRYSYQPKLNYFQHPTVLILIPEITRRYFFKKKKKKRELTCPLQVTDDYFITYFTHVVAPFVPWSLPLNSDWLNRWPLSLEKLTQRKAVQVLHVNVFKLKQQYKPAFL